MKAAPTKLISVLVAYLTAIKFPATYNGAACPFSGQSMFDAVKVFDMEDIVAAFAELLVFKNRAAFIVMTHERQDSRISGRNMEVFFHNEFAILISDRSYKNRNLALIGDATTPGVLLISDVLVQAMIGEIQAGYLCEPNGGEVFALSGKERDNEVGRIGYRQDVTLHGGTIVKPLSRIISQTYAP